MFHSLHQVSKHVLTYLSGLADDGRLGLPEGAHAAFDSNVETAPRTWLDEAVAKLGAREE